MLAGVSHPSILYQAPPQLPVLSMPPTAVAQQQDSSPADLSQQTRADPEELPADKMKPACKPKAKDSPEGKPTAKTPARKKKAAKKTRKKAQKTKMDKDAHSESPPAVPVYGSLEARLLSVTSDGISESFPSKLHRCLLDLDEIPGGSDIACFLQEGQAFMILDPVRFESEVMRKYYPRMGSFASFQRQLNIYDFSRIAKGPQKGAYFHQYFIKTYPLLSRSMKRSKKK